MVPAHAFGEAPEGHEEDRPEDDEPATLVAEVEGGGHARERGDHARPARHVPAREAQRAREFEGGEGDQGAREEHEQRLDEDEAADQQHAEAHPDEDGERQVAAGARLDLDGRGISIVPILH